MDKFIFESPYRKSKKDFLHFHVKSKTELF